MSITQNINVWNITSETGTVAGAAAVNADCLQQPSHPFLPPLFLFPGAPERWWWDSGHSCSRWPKIAPAEPATAVISRRPLWLGTIHSKAGSLRCHVIVHHLSVQRSVQHLDCIHRLRSFQEFGCAVALDMAVLKLVDQVFAFGCFNTQWTSKSIYGILLNYAIQYNFQCMHKNGCDDALYTRFDAKLCICSIYKSTSSHYIVRYLFSWKQQYKSDSFKLMNLILWEMLKMLQVFVCTVLT